MALQADMTPQPHSSTGWWWALVSLVALILSAGATWLWAGGWQALTSRPARGQIAAPSVDSAALVWPADVSLRSPSTDRPRAYRFSWGLLPEAADGAKPVANSRIDALPPLVTETLVTRTWQVPAALTTAPLTSAGRRYRPWLRESVPLVATFPRLSPRAWGVAEVVSQLYQGFGAQYLHATGEAQSPPVPSDVRKLGTASWSPSLVIAGQLTGLAAYLGSWPPPALSDLAFSYPTSSSALVLSSLSLGAQPTRPRAETGAGEGTTDSAHAVGDGRATPAAGGGAAVPALATGLGSVGDAGGGPANRPDTEAGLGEEAAATPGTQLGSGTEPGGEVSPGESPTQPAQTPERGRWQVPQPSLVPLGGMIRPAATYSPLPPQTIRGVYATGYLAGSERMTGLVQTVVQAGLDAVVVEIKDEYGVISYDSRIPLARQIGAAGSKIKDIQGLLNDLHRQGLYVIARMVTFQDGKLAQARPEWAVRSRQGGLWRNQVGLAWVDPGLGPVWEYEVDVAEEALQLGFDEVQFDYVRFPTDGDVDNMLSVVPASRRVEAISSFLAYARQRLAPYGRPISADAFGFVATADSDLGIGQHLEEMSHPVDYVSLMVYPSHYPAHSYGFTDPDLNPYGVVHYAMKRASQRVGAAKQRPWLQSFSLRHPYGPAQLLDQLRAVAENGINSWLLWNASGRYTQLRGLMFP